jgi:hypothetical protein
MPDAVPQQPRSSFVTALAWVFIALAGFTTLIAILQNVMIAVMFPADFGGEVRGTSDMPAFFRIFFSYPRVFFGAFLVVSAATLISAIGLLRRKNWARLLFIAVMVLGILWNLGGFVLMLSMTSSMPAVPDSGPPGFRDGFDIMWKVMLAFSIVIGLAFLGLFGWIIKRLMSHEIRREFIAL